MNSLEEILAEALRITQEAKIPSHLESVAFSKAIDALSKTVRLAPDLERSHRPAKTEDVYDEDGIGPIAAKLALDSALVSEVFHYENDAPHLTLGAAKLKAEKAAATRDLAILVAGSRQLAGIEEWTPSRIIRQVCDDYGRFDNANFASTLLAMADVFGFKGKGQSREVRLNKIGYEELKRLIISLAGTSA